MGIALCLGYLFVLSIAVDLFRRFTLEGGYPDRFKQMSDRLILQVVRYDIVRLGLCC